MQKLKVKSENLPTRCDVCHQSDLFNRANGYCERCRHTAFFREREEQQLAQQIPAQEPETDQRVNVALFTLMAISCLFGIFVGLTNSFVLPEIIMLAIMLPLCAGGLIKFLIWANKSNSTINNNGNL